MFLPNIDMSQAQLDSSGTFLKIPDPSDSDNDYLFGTANGIFAVDTRNGAILGLKKAATKDFDPTVAGTYKAIYYQKTNASTGQGNVETGTASLGNASLTVTNSKMVTISDAQGNQIAQGTVAPVADTAYMYLPDNSELQDPCFGVFTFRVTTASSQQDVFVTFMDRAMLFASFSVNQNSAGKYNYLYGVALK